MQNIVEVKRKDTRMAIVLRDVTGGTYSVQGYRQIPNGEFCRQGTVYQGWGLKVALFAADKFVENR